ncbi:MAG: multicopper oxidase domain-containing protein [Verrucomicrobia bacterium]|nr:multicopper oxidase domain-containing protein [Verrucomicrobiota bacterium]
MIPSFRIIPRFGVLTLLLGFALLLPTLAHEGEEHGTKPPGLPEDCLAVTNLTPFLDPLPIPTVAVPARTNAQFRLPWDPSIVFENVPEYDLTMTSFQHRFHRDLPPVEVWGYGGTYPGPTIRAITNVPILVNWTNALPAQYPAWLPANTNFHGVTNQNVRTVVHLHGAATLPRYDGYPTNDFFSGSGDTYLYNNWDLNGDGETMWYHDHAVGLTANNVYAGLEGFYLLTSPGFESQFQLPKGPYEIPLVFQDRDIQTNCLPASLLYNGVPFHNLATVNGVVMPYLEVEPRRYRFRILDGANYRTFGLNALAPNGTNLTFYVIGTEDGFLQQTVTATALNMMPGERLDVILDFTGFAGTNVTLVSQTINAVPATAPAISNLLQFRVILPLQGTDTSVIPTVIIPTNEWVTTASMVEKATVNRQVTLDLANELPFPGPPFLSSEGSPFALLNLSFFDDPITEFPEAGSTEVWSLINLTSEAHPIHIHLLDFRVVDRIRFAGFSGTLSRTNPPPSVVNYINDRQTDQLKPLATYLGTNAVPAAAFESGPKDVVRAAPYSVTRIVMTWPTNSIFYTSPSARDLDQATVGRYIFHCHLLEHEDDDMMRPLQLVAPSPYLNWLVDPAVNPEANNHLRFWVLTETNAAYRLESAPSVQASSWSAGQLIPGTGERVDVIPPPSFTPALQYRIRSVPRP